jgi:hypothetical protein
MKQNPAHGDEKQHEKQHAGASADTLQQRKDELEKRKHPASENALDSTQDKNPMPEGTRRKE